MYFINTWETLQNINIQAPPKSQCQNNWGMGVAHTHQYFLKSHRWIKSAAEKALLQWLELIASVFVSATTLQRPWEWNIPSVWAQVSPVWARGILPSDPTVHFLAEEDHTSKYIPSDVNHWFSHHEIKLLGNISYISEMREPITRI